MGVRPVEFLHAGNRADHQDHVHVAYAFGPDSKVAPYGMPFTTAREAGRWEQTKAKGEKVATFKPSSITTNSGEMVFNGGNGYGGSYGGGHTINAPISIYQQPGQDPEELATIVVTRLGMAVESLTNFV